ncbi:MAG: alpha/beta hydrolase [Candidatus Pacebacteria bacterium]|nr:alpha/beta hydrolase [Candidatus Paceibacterota bacterium]PIR59511.1 MAG: hypothetical protein COU68_05130 [Candidatus Pacebacteria bacterium CG10_big_fil_rev_8_21_14_0_10_45_6]
MSFYSHKDSKIYYRILGKKGALPLVFLHGWAQTNQFWNNLIKELTPKYRLVIFDLPGCGNSQSPTTIWNLKDYSHMLHDFLVNQGLKKPVLIGHSFGARIALDYASRFSLRKLVLYSPGINRRYNILNWSHRKLSQLSLIFRFTSLMYWLQSQIFRPKSFKNNHVFKKINTRTMISIYLKKDNIQISLLKKIDIPTLILAGEKDKILPLSSIKKFAKYIKSKKIYIFSDAHHCAHIEFQKAFLFQLKSFLDD